MKTVVVAGLLFVGVSGQVFSMGHPHNMFAARKQMQAKSSVSVSKAKVNSPVYCATVVQLTKNVLSKLVARPLASAL